jgi:hypothetical protein
LAGKIAFLQSSITVLDCARELNNFPEKLNNFFGKGENSVENKEKPALFEGADLVLIKKKQQARQATL